MNRLYSALLMVFAFVVSASAQSTPPAPKDTTKPTEVPFYELEEVVVTAPRTARSILRVPMAIDVVSREEIQRAQASVTLNEIFRSVPGISVDNRYNFSTGERFVIRGSGSRDQVGIRGMKILLDGIPLSTADGSSNVKSLNLSSIARAEIIRGTASSLYGNASNGVINLTTGLDHHVPLAIQARATTGAFGLQKWEGSLMGTTGSTGYMLNLSRTTSDGFRGRSESQVVRMNASAIHSLSNTMKLAALATFYNTPYSLNPGALTLAELTTDRTMASPVYLNAGASQKEWEGIGGLTMSYDDGVMQKLDATVYYSRRKRNSATTTSVSVNDFTSGGARLLYKRNVTFGSMPIQWSLGAEYEGVDNDRTRRRNLLLPPDKRGTTPPQDVLGLIRSDTLSEAQLEGVSSFGAFTELEVELSPEMILLLSGRYDHFMVDAKDKLLTDGSDDSGSRTLSHFSPSVGFLYRLSRYSSAYANVSTGFQVPILRELRNRFLGAGGLNYDVQPEIVRTVEIGLKGVVLDSRFTYDLSLFNATYNDMLISYQISDGSDTYYKNAGRAINRGIEGKLQWELMEGLKGSLAVTMMDFVFDDYVVEQEVSGQIVSFQLKDKKVPTVSPTRVYLGGSYRHSSGIFSEVYVQWVDKTFLNDFNDTPPGETTPNSQYINDAYTNVDARFGYTQRISGVEVELFGGVNNVFDKHYIASVVPNATRERFFEPSPGRNWYAGLRILFTALR